MNRRWALAAGWVVMLALGCSHPQTTRSQSAEDPERDKEAEVATVGAVASFADPDPFAVSGVGLVAGLSGTGGDAPVGSYRSLLEDQLRKAGVQNIKEMLGNPDFAMVLVTGLIPAGARKGDPIDVEITLPPGSKVTSLRGGVLTDCALVSYDTARHVSRGYEGPDRLLKGDRWAVAKGPVVVGVGRPARGPEGGEADPEKAGRVWGGGRCLKDREFTLLLNPDRQMARIAAQVADRVNATFPGPRFGNDVLARALDKQQIVLKVPPQYRHNLPHFMRVACGVPLAGPPPADGPYRHRLEEQLLDPARTNAAAIRLEALGLEGAPPLKAALQSPYPLVRFAAAEALAYLGQADGSGELARLVEEQPVLRAYCLTALASLDHTAGHLKLEELLARPEAEVRYGAFRALRALDDRDPLVAGELLNDSFWLHRAGSDGPPLVHLLSGKRAEVVLFGNAPSLAPPFSFLVGPEFTVTAGATENVCTVSRFSVKHGRKQRQCPLQLAEVVRSLGELGGSYADVTDLLRQAERTGSLACALATDALPKAPTVQQLAQLGASDPTLRSTAAADVGATPNLFDPSEAPRPRRGAAAAADAAGGGQ
jgi:hypothetical protein